MSLSKLQNQISTMLQQVQGEKRVEPNKIVVGEFQNKVKEFLENQRISPSSSDIFLLSNRLSHLARESKKKRGAGLEKGDILRIPSILQNPSLIIFDTNKSDLLYIGESNFKKGKIVKIVVAVDKHRKKQGRINFIKTAGYIEEANLKNPNYMEVWREAGGR
ncbi:MAG: hypothetical protein C6I01_05400 [Epsilonproteobacteria bacterium]|nr:hypothetical protein [Campylobacterota bacterium]NPA89438.1 hypothetical protein [Campylobacterota bacterium]